MTTQHFEPASPESRPVKVIPPKHNSAWRTALAVGFSIFVSRSSFANATDFILDKAPFNAPSFFPLAVWLQNPTVRGKSGVYPTIGAAAAAMKLNIVLGIGNWPERFGSDDGELAAAKAHDLYVIGGMNTPWSENTSAQSVASVLALATSLNAKSNLLGYNAGDEPDCAGDNGLPGFANIPAAMKKLQSYDPTRLIAFNQTFWPMQPYWWGTCATPSIEALHSIGIASADYYPITNPNLIHYDYSNPNSLPSHFYAGISNFLSVPNDTLWVQGVLTMALVHAAKSDQPTWMFVEAGGDNLGLSASFNSFAGALSLNSTTLTNLSGWSQFTSAWLGLTVSGAGIPTGTTIIGVLDHTHALVSHAATSSEGNIQVTVTGGDVSNTDCIERDNLCVVNGNEFRPTASEVNAEVWTSIINGATGIEYFCHDSSSDFFCMGDLGGGLAAQVASDNLHSINRNVLKYAAILKTRTLARCSMQHMNFVTGKLSTSNSCEDNGIQMSSNTAALPGQLLVKRFGTTTYLFAQSDRRSTGGAAFTFTIPGLAHHKAKVVYDSDTWYDPQHAMPNEKITLDASGKYTDVLGAHADNYQVKIYEIVDPALTGY
jgi:hypothetical protein